MYVYLFIYFFNAGLTFLARSRRHSKVFAAFFVLFLVAFAGTRYQVGCDWVAYSMRYEYLYDNMTWMQAVEGGEGGFNWLNMVLLNWGFSFATLILVSAAIYCLCLLRFATLARQSYSFLVLSFPVLVLQLGMSGLRQALATGFLMLALVAFVKKSRWQVVAWILVASQFHASSIIFLPIALLVGRRVSAMRLIGVMVLASPVVAWFLGERIEVYNNRYVEQIYGENDSNGAWFRYALVLIPFAVLEWKRKLVEPRFPEVYQMLRLFSFITFTLFPVGLVSSVALHRLVFYVMPASILALLCVSDSVYDQRSARAGSAIPLFMYGAYIIVWFGLSRHGTSCYVPYESWLL